MSGPELIGKARGYREFIAILRAFYEEHQITRETLDDECGLTARHASRLLAPIPLKNFGFTSLPLVLNECGLELWIMKVNNKIEDMPKRRRKLHASA